MKSLFTAALLSLLAFPAWGQEIMPDVPSGVLTVSGTLALDGPEGSGNGQVDMRSHRVIMIGAQGATDCLEVADPEQDTEFKRKAQQLLGDTVLHLSRALSADLTFNCRAVTLSEQNKQHAGVPFVAAAP